MFRKKKTEHMEKNEQKTTTESINAVEEKNEKEEKKSRFSFRKKKEETESLYGEEIEQIKETVFDQEEYDQDAERFSENQKENTGEDVLDIKGRKENREKKKSLFGRRKKENRKQTADDGQETEQVDEEGIIHVQEEKKRFLNLSKKRLAILGGAAVLVIGGIGWFMISNLQSDDAGKAYVESVKEITGLGSSNGINNRYTGIVEPQDSWKISLQSDLSVSKCFVEVGDEVKKGDKLFTYNTEELKLSKEKKELEVETLENENTQLNKDIKTYQQDLKSASASEKIELQTEILTAQTTIKKNEYSIKSGNKEIKKLKAKIKDATVTSKMDGVVKTINQSLGEGASDDSDVDDAAVTDMETDDGSTYMTILAVGDYRIKGTVSETNVWSLSEGDPVIVRSRVDDTTWKGTINKINTDATADNGDAAAAEETDFEYTDEGGSGENASTYNFYVELDSDDGLMMGQHVFLEQDNGQDEEREGLWLPSAYIHADGEDYYVWAANGRDRLTLKKITVGEYNEDLDEYEVLKGVELSDYIAFDADNLKENMKTTKVVPEEENSEDYLEPETSDDDVSDDFGDDGEMPEDDLVDEELTDDGGVYDDADVDVDEEMEDSGLTDEETVDFTE